MKRVTLVVSGHLSTCPRMVKAADALAGAGHAVRFVSVLWEEAWGREDEALAARRRWEWAPVRMDRGGGRVAAEARLLARLSRQTLGALGTKAPAGVALRASSKAFGPLAARILEDPGDLVYGGTAGGIAPAAAAARKASVPWAVDLEDLYSENEEPADGPGARAAREAEADALPGAAFVTAGSAGIAAACATAHGRRVLAIHNCFPLPAAPPDTGPGAGPLRLYWFSQTLGPDRGLAEAARAAALSGIEAVISLRGRPVPGAVEEIRRGAAASGGRVRMEVLPPGPPDSMVDLCRGHDAGLCLERRTPRSKDLCLSNKALTYPLAGLAVVLTDTAGQRTLAGDLGEGALLYQPGDPGALAEGLARWGADRGALRRAREASWDAARRRWHWEHESERGALLAAVRGVLG